MSARPVWPVQQPEAPWDDPPAELGYGQMSRHLGARTPPRAVYDARVAALLAALREGAECAALGHELGVDGTVHPRGGDYEVEVDRPATVPELIRVATDHYPAAGSDAADVLLGPYADALDVRRPDDLFALKVALAAMALVPSDLVGQTAYERWANTKPRPSLEDRAMVRAVLWAPWTLWELVDGERVDRLGLSAWSNPAPGPLASVLPCEDDAPWLAKVVGTPSGAKVALGFRVPALPSAARVESIAREVLWRGRLGDRRAPHHVFYAREGHVLVRRIHEWMWATAG